MNPIYLLSAAGGAEASWKALMGIIFFAFLIPNALSFLSILLSSRWCAIAAVFVFVLFSLVLQPWLGFVPLTSQDYEDPDVVDAASGFRNVGVYWVCSFLFLIFACTLVYRMLHELSRYKPVNN